MTTGNTFLHSCHLLSFLQIIFGKIKKKKFRIGDAVRVERESNKGRIFIPYLPFGTFLMDTVYMCNNGSGVTAARHHTIYSNTIVNYKIW
jgi:hypothetical protein